MYYYALQLSSIPPRPNVGLELVAEQACAYLACLNSIALVDDAYSWIVVNRPGDSDGGRVCLTHILVYYSGWLFHIPFVDARFESAERYLVLTVNETTMVSLGYMLSTQLMVYQTHTIVT